MKMEDLEFKIEDRIAKLWNADELGANPTGTIAVVIVHEFVRPMLSAIEDLRSERARLEQLYEEYPPGTYQNRMAESLLDAIDGVKANE